MTIGVYMNGKIQSTTAEPIDKLVTIPGITVDGISLDDTILIHELAVNAAIPKNVSFDLICKVYEENFDFFRQLSTYGETILGGYTVDKNIGYRNNRLNLLPDKSLQYFKLRGVDSLPEGENLDDYVWEYDSINTFMHMLPFKFTVDKEVKPLRKNYDENLDSSIREFCILPESLRVLSIDYSEAKDGSMKRLFYHKRGNYFLNATLRGSDNYYQIREIDAYLSKVARKLNAHYKDFEENVDLTKLVYGMFLSSIYIKLPKNEAIRFKETIDIVGSVLAEYVLVQGGVKRGFTAIDSVVTKEPWSYDFTLPSFRVKHRYLPHEDRIEVDSRLNVLVDNQLEKYSADDNLENKLGWYSADFEKIKKLHPGWSIYHIDIHAAYVNLIRQKTGVIVEKNDVGKFKSVDPYLFQGLCNSISERSRQLIEFYGKDQQLVFWRTDGGLCLIRDTVDIELMMDANTDVVVEKIVGSIAHKLSPDIDLNFGKMKYKRLSQNRIFAYTIFYGEIKKESRYHDLYANNFKKYSAKIIKHNSIKGVAKLDIHSIIRVLSKYSKEVK